MKQILPPWFEVAEGRENLESQLRREIGAGHQLFGCEVRAVAQRGDNDDVLFEIVGDSGAFVVVHLTWSGAIESMAHLPATTIYDSWDAWCNDCMIPASEGRAERDWW